MDTTTLPYYSHDLIGLRESLKRMLPPPALTAFDGYAEQLDKQLISILKVKAGDQAPEFTLSNAVGNPVSLRDKLKSGRVVLVFYRGSWCPYCNLQLNQLQNALDIIKEHDANLIAISPQTPDATLSFIEKNNLAFEVLSDVGNGVAKMYTTVFRHDDEATAVLNALGIDFNAHYSDNSNELPVTAVFVINQNGEIVFAKSEGGDFRNRVELSEILSALK